jgi:hypothetical protein
MRAFFGSRDAMWDCGLSERSGQLMLFLIAGPAILRHVSGNMESSAESSIAISSSEAALLQPNP